MADNVPKVVRPEAVALEIKGFPPTIIVTRVAETWQFFAFVFAALVTLALALLDEIPNQPWRMAAKGVAFVGLGYLVLVNVRVRDWLATMLVRFKQERR